MAITAQPISVKSAYIETFNNNVIHLAQQTQSRLRRTITEVNKQSEKHNWDFLGASKAREKTGPRMVSPSGGDGSGAVGSDAGLSWSRRQTLIKTFDTGEVIEKENIVQMLIDPKSASTKNLVMNMQRQVDDIIVGAATGAAKDGAGQDIAYKATQKIGDGTKIISLDTIMAGVEGLLSHDIDPDEYKTLVIGPKQWHTLLKQLELTSGDFTAGKPINTGMLPNVLGVNEIIISNRLKTTSTAVSCLLYCKSGIGLHVAGDIRSTAAERADMSFAWQVYMLLNMDAVRLEDEKVYQLEVKNALA